MKSPDEREVKTTTDGGFMVIDPTITPIAQSHGGRVTETTEDEEVIKAKRRAGM